MRFLERQKQREREIKTASKRVVGQLFRKFNRNFHKGLAKVRHRTSKQTPKSEVKHKLHLKPVHIPVSSHKGKGTEDKDREKHQT